MEKNNSKNYMGFDRAAKENWYLTCLPVKPAPKVKIRLADGREHIYKGRNTIKKGNVAVIGRGCNSSFEMGEVIEVGVAGGGKSYMSNAQYVFASNPSQEEIKKMAGKIFDLQDAETAYKEFKLTNKLLAGNVNIPVVDTDIESVLFSCCVLAHEGLATASAIKKARTCLEKPKYLCSELLGTRINESMQKPYYPMILLEFSGYYSQWEEDFLKPPLCAAMENKRSIQLYENSFTYEKGSKDLEKFIRGNKEFSEFYNELIFRSALSMIIRGGFVNLLDAALRVHMPIEMFYGKLIGLAQETGSTYCLSILEPHKAEYT